MENYDFRALEVFDDCGAYPRLVYNRSAHSNLITIDQQQDRSHGYLLANLCIHQVHLNRGPFNGTILLAAVIDNSVFHDHSPIFTSPHTPRTSDACFARYASSMLVFTASPTPG